MNMEEPESASILAQILLGNLTTGGMAMQKKRLDRKAMRKTRGGGNPPPPPAPPVTPAPTPGNPPPPTPYPNIGSGGGGGTPRPKIAR